MTMKAFASALRFSMANAIVMVAALLAFAVLPVADAFACGGETPVSASDTGASGKAPDHDGERRETDHHNCPHGHGHHTFGQPPVSESDSLAFPRSASEARLPRDHLHAGRSPTMLDPPPKVVGQA